jgi:AraC-like DNA-binding protein
MNGIPLPAPRQVPITLASTVEVEAADRLRYWEAYTASALIGVRCSSFASEGLLARQRNFDLGALRLAEIAGNEHVVERSAQVMRRHPKDSLFVSLLVEGEAFFYQSGRCIPLHEGDLIVYGTSTPYLYGVNRRSRQVQVDLPLEQLMDSCPLPPLLEPIRIDGTLRSGQQLTQPLRREILQFVEAPLAAAAPAAARRIQALVEGLLRAQGIQRGRGAEMRLLKAEAFIARHLADPQLNAAAVARHMAMSVRNLNRVFEQHGCSVTQWIWRERLARAHALLADPSRAAMPIGEIALGCGFSTQAHFARAFRHSYGCTPSEHRAAAGVHPRPAVITGS